MKEIIRRILKEEYKKMSSLPRNIIISIYDDMNISLYDFVNGEILGFVGLSRNKDGTYYFPMIASEKGFGPTVLEVALMFCHPNGLMVSRDGDIRGDAFNVWEKMYKRNDVIKETLPLSDKNFNFAIVTGENDQTYENEFEKMSEFDYHIEEGYKDTIRIYNTKMMLTPSEEYEKLIDLSLLLDHKEIYEQGRDYFSMRYNN